MFGQNLLSYINKIKLCKNFIFNSLSYFYKLVRHILNKLLKLYKTELMYSQYSCYGGVYDVCSRQPSTKSYYTREFINVLTIIIIVTVYEVLPHFLKFLSRSGSINTCTIFCKYFSSCKCNAFLKTWTIHCKVRCYHIWLRYLILLYTFRMTRDLLHSNVLVRVGEGPVELKPGSLTSHFVTINNSLTTVMMMCANMCSLAAFLEELRM